MVSRDSRGPPDFWLRTVAAAQRRMKFASQVQRPPAWAGEKEVQMNSVNLIGRLTRDPELRSVEGQKPVCRMRLAVNGTREDDVTYVDVVTFDKQAEACAKHLTKGREVAVSGRLSYSEWVAEDGSKRSRHEVIGRVRFLSGRNGSAPDGVGAGAGEAKPDEGIPF
jgi:single-strand DNA-binding protein